MGYCYCQGAKPGSGDGNCVCQSENVVFDVMMPFFCFCLLVCGAFTFVPQMFVA